jgi:antitoxin component YwqK of YwqJK toxin-antitoxin module
MTRQDQLEFCNKCVNRKFDSNQGIICSLTNQIANFETTCDKFILDQSVRPLSAEEEASSKTNIILGELDEVGLQKLRSHQDFNFAIVGGLVATLVSAVLWAIITVAAKYQIGYMAVGVGLLVGFAVRFFGAGVDKKFGFLGAGLALLGCLLGNLFSQIGFAALDQAQGYFEIISLLTPGIVFSVLAETFQPMDLLFYGIAIYEGYRFAFRPVPNDLINNLKSADFEGLPSNHKFRLPMVIAGIVIISVFIFTISRGVNGHKMYLYESGMKQAEGELKRSKPDGKWTTWHENGKMQSEGFFANGIMDGSWKWYDENGNLSKTGQYAKGMETGVWLTYFPNGAVIDSGNYTDGRKNGKWIVNYENGTLFQTGNFNRDVQQGIWEAYYENGNPISKGKMEENKAVGKWTYFFANGQLANEVELLSDDKVFIWNSFDSTGKQHVANGNGLYKEFSATGQLLQTGNVENGHKVGKWSHYFENGKLKTEGRYADDFFLLENSWDSNGNHTVKNGSGTFVAYYPDGTTMSESGDYRDGYKTGTWRTFYENSDKVLQEVQYEKGILNGIHKQYYESGGIFAEGMMVNNCFDGEWNWYFEDGKNESKVIFKLNKKEGIQTMWNSDGEKLKEEYFENGKFVKVVVF